MRLACARHLGDTFADQCLGHNELRRTRGRLRLAVGTGKLFHILPINLLHAPPVSFEPRHRVFALREKRHGVERHIVGIVDQDEVVQLQVAGQRASLARHPLLQAAVASQADDLMVKNAMFGRIETSFGHFPGHGQADRIGHTLPQRTGGALHARCLAKLRMPWCDTA